MHIFMSVFLQLFLSVSACFQMLRSAVSADHAWSASVSLPVLQGAPGQAGYVAPSGSVRSAGVAGFILIY